MTSDPDPKRTDQSRDTSVSVGRARLSRFVNKWLNKLGYALVRIKGERGPTSHSTHMGIRYAYEDLLIADGYAPWALDNAFLYVWERASKNTLADIFRAYELYQLVRESRGVPGDVLEVGVWRGGTGAVLAAATNRWRPESRVWLCDTFRGVVKTGEFDASYSGGEHADTTRERVEDLVSALALRDVTILEGVFPDDTATRISDRRISLCHVDVDVYQSAMDVVAWVAARMKRGGIIVFDDYGFSSCKGITRCVDELRETGDWLYIHNLNKHAILIRK